jgi:fatty acid synthase subunit beta
VEKIFVETNSPRMDEILKGWEKDGWESAEKRQRLAYNLLTECLAYQ